MDANPRVVIEFQRETYDVEVVLNHSATHWGSFLDASVRHALSDPEVGRLVVTVELRNGKGNIAYDEIDASV